MKPLRILLAIALLFISTASYAGGYGYYGYGYRPGYYNYGYAYPSNYYNYGYGYPINYQWWNAQVYNGRWWRAGYYAWVNGAWYRQGYGYDYGILLPVAPLTTQVLTLPAGLPQTSLRPANGAQQVQKESANLTPEEIRIIRAILNEGKQQPPVAKP